MADKEAELGDDDTAVHDDRTEQVEAGDDDNSSFSPSEDGNMPISKLNNV